MYQRIYILTRYGLGNTSKEQLKLQNGISETVL